MPTERLPRYALFFQADDGWKMSRSGQQLTLEKGMKILTRELTRVDAVRLPG